MKLRNKITGAVLASVALSSAAYAQLFGIPSIVLDPTQAVHALLQITQFSTQIEQALQQYNLLIQTYRTTVGTYETIVAMSKMIGGKNGWMYVTSPYSYPSAANISGVTGGWMGTLNTGTAAVSGWQAATLRAPNPLMIQGMLSSQGQTAFAAQYGTVELREGIAQNAMTVTGSVRGDSALQQAALAQLQAQSLSDDDAENTEVGVLNKINAATMIHAQADQDTNQYLGAIVDQQTISLKQIHDVQVDEMNTAIAVQAATAATIDSIWAGDAAAHAARLP